jgi:hypothetical protein
MYKLTNIKFFDELTKRDYYYINLATNIANESKFDSSKRIGAVLLGQGKCVFRR